MIHEAVTIAGRIVLGMASTPVSITATGLRVGQMTLTTIELTDTSRACGCHPVRAIARTVTAASFWLFGIRKTILVLFVASLTAACSPVDADPGAATTPGSDTTLPSAGSDDSGADPASIPSVFGTDSDSEDTATEEVPYSTGLTFHGYPCRLDCSGHEAGYEWAEEKGITDPDDCGGNSESFIEGCRAFAGDEGDAADEPDSDQDETDEEDEE